MELKIDMKTCRICLVTKKPMSPLFKYKLSGNYAEMLTAIANVKVAARDGLPDKICNKCCMLLEKAFILKNLAERNDRKLRSIVEKLNMKVPTKKIAFDSFIDIKKDIAPLAIKSEPKWEMEIEVLDCNKPIETMEGKDIVIANTVIKKVDGNFQNHKPLPPESDNLEIKPIKKSDSDKEDDAEYLDDDFFQDDDDDEYVPPMKIKKFKKPKLSEIKVYKDKKVVKKVKVIKKENSSKNSDGKSNATTITCYPILKNGNRGAPILLKRPKDATVLKFHPNFRLKKTTHIENKIVCRDKPLRTVRQAKAVSRQKEKLVCPVCGILTMTLNNHMATHQEKKRFTCPQCPRTFAQKGNMHDHMKQHQGIKDHICEICGAGFYNQKSLVRHNLIHKGERPFQCNLCSKSFIARCDLNRHQRIHSGYKPFKCATCAMSFNAKHQLQNHERMHTGERPYTCQVCNVAFSYKVNLNNHVYKVHGINLKFKSIHTVTEEVLRKEMNLMSEARAAISQIMPQLGEVPTPAAHETVSHHNTEY